MKTCRIRPYAGRPPAPGAGRDDLLAVEAPLRIRVDGADLGVVMRTPGADDALAAGFACSEGFLPGPEALDEVRVCGPSQVEETRNVAEVRRVPGAGPAPDASLRTGLVTSGCGVCGRTLLEAVARAAPRVPAPPPLPAATLLGLAPRLGDAQEDFARTGGLHAAGLFDAAGTLRHHAEDVGRHNAVDKVIGRALLDGPWPPPPVLVVTSRASFDIVQKAGMAGIPVVACVSAPSSLAVDLAEQLGITLVGFLREASFNLYSGGDLATP